MANKDGPSLEESFSTNEEFLENHQQNDPESAFQEENVEISIVYTEDDHRSTTPTFQQEDIINDNLTVFNELPQTYSCETAQQQKPVPVDSCESSRNDCISKHGKEISSSRSDIADQNGTGDISSQVNA